MKKVSLYTVMYVLLVAVLLILCLVLVFVNEFYQQQHKAEEQRAAEYRMDRSLALLEQELASAQNTLSEISEWFSGLSTQAHPQQDPVLCSLDERQQARELVVQRSKYSDCMDFLYIADRDQKYIVSQSKLNGSEALRLRDHFLSQKPDAFVPGRTQWDYIQLDGQGYLFMARQLQRHEVGCAIRIDSVASFFAPTETGLLLFNTFSAGNQTIFSQNAYAGEKAPDVERALDVTSSRALPGTGLTITQISRNTTAESPQQRIIQYILLAGVVLMIGLTLTLYFWITVPLNALQQAIKTIDNGDSSCRITCQPRDKAFSRVIESFNHMMNEIVGLKIVGYERELSAVNQRLRMLRAQIRPHAFLNCLTTLSSLIQQNRNEDALYYLKQFSVHARHLLRTEREMISLREEMQHVKSYIALQKVRFPHSVACVCDVEAQIENMPVPQLLIYTLVENCIKHAMDLQETLIILIRCEQDDASGVYVTVEDNGAGFQPQQLGAYHLPESEQEHRGEHLGLSNIYQTLYLIYHRDDLMTLYNTQPHGAKIVLHIPEWERKDETHEIVDC